MLKNSSVIYENGFEKSIDMVFQSCGRNIQKPKQPTRKVPPVIFLLSITSNRPICFYWFIHASIWPFSLTNCDQDILSMTMETRKSLLHFIPYCADDNIMVTVAHETFRICIRILVL